MTSYLLFPTSLGTCGLAWGERGLVAMRLPADSPEATARQLAERHEPCAPGAPGDPPEFVREAVSLLRAHLDGRPQDLSALPLDLERFSPFTRRVYELTRQVAPGRTVTYGELAARAGSPGAARAVGQAMASNPLLLLVPCHRVLAAGGRPGGFSAPGGWQTKQRLLALEGVSLEKQGSLFGGTGTLPFDPAAAVEQLKAADPKLAAVIEKVGPLRLQLEAMNSPFESLAEAIVFQQLTGKAASTILGRFKTLFGGRFPTPDELHEASEERLRSAGLSGPKIRALHDLAAKARCGDVPGLCELAPMSDEEIVERLSAIRGIGRWTVEMLLVFRLGRPDVLPSTDYGIRKGFARMLGRKALPAPADVERRGKRWRPYRTAASWYLWRVLDL